jgi:hypothetical protein
MIPRDNSPRRWTKASWRGVVATGWISGMGWLVKADDRPDQTTARP